LLDLAHAEKINAKKTMANVEKLFIFMTFICSFLKADLFNQRGRLA
jgi:hypothetical protein